MNDLSCDNLQANEYQGLESAGYGVRTLVQPLISDPMPKPDTYGQTISENRCQQCAS
jgi:hypothetical protein